VEKTPNVEKLTIIVILSFHIAEDNYSNILGNYTKTHKHPRRCSSKSKQGDV
jgi:hypothetical protein